MNPVRPMHELDSIVATIRRALDQGERGVLVTVVRTEGSTYRRPGARVVITEKGEAAGAISGGCLERDLAERIRPWLDEMRPRVVRYDSTRPDDLVFGLGLGCRGILDLLVEPFDATHVPALLDFRWNGREAIAWTTGLPDGGAFVEVIRPQRTVAVFGAGPDVEPVVRLGEQLGWRLDVVTTREPVDLSGYDAAVVMTHNFPRDAAILPRLLDSTVAYIGLLGPKSRGAELLAEIGRESDARIHSPAGLDIGGETPEEIALSIVAEIQAVLNRRPSGALREREAPIHEEAPDLTWA